MPQTAENISIRPGLATGPSSQFLLGENQDENIAIREKTTKQKYFSGRTVSLRAFAVCVALILTLNVGFLVHASQNGKQYGAWQILQGDYDTVKRADLVIHAIVNVIGIILLAAVGSYLTVLSSPTRRHLDAAHETGHWLDIGIPSISNFKYMGGFRVWFWSLLFLLSLPLHILYNSTVYVHTTTYSFYWMVVTEDFATSANFNTSGLPTSCEASFAGPTAYDVPKLLSMRADSSNYTKLDAAECLKIYSGLYPMGYSDLIMVTSDTNNTNSILAWDDLGAGNNPDLLCAPAMACGDLGAFVEGSSTESATACDLTTLQKNPSEWTNFGHPIEYCLAQPVEQNNYLLLDPTLSIIMIVANTGVLLIMIICLTGYWRELNQSLGCFGDVLSSYITQEEAISHGMCLADKSRVDYFWKTRGTAAPIDQRKRRCYHVLTRSRLYVLCGILAIGLICCIAILGYSLHILKDDRHLSLSPHSLWELGFGSTTASEALYMNVGGSPASLAVTANVPQLFLAIITLFTNTAVAEMTQASEYTRYISSKKTLRVSNPVGKQRGTYLLGMPYRYAIPMIAVTSALHWGISQSIVPAIVISLSTNPNNYWTFDDSDVVFSPLAIIVSVVLAAVFICTLFVLGWKKLQPTIPLASSCSLALSAAVHPHGTNDPFAEYLPLKWGVVSFLQDGIGHCSFSTSDGTLEPEANNLYC